MREARERTGTGLSGLLPWFTLLPEERRPGFRLALSDLGFLALLAALSLLIYRLAGPDYYIYLLPLYLGASFFLFCNVFRIGNRLEALWYVPFVLSAMAGFYYIEHFWWIVLCISEPLKAGLIAYRIIKGPYHGVLHGRLRGCVKRPLT